MSLLALAWMAEVGLISYRSVSRGRPAEVGGGKVPWPADYAASFVVFGSLSLLGELSGGWDRVAAVAGWGFVLATVLNLVDPTISAPTKSVGTTVPKTAAPGAPSPTLQRGSQ